MVNFATFLCDACALQHYRFFPAREHYLKHIDTEHFDQFQQAALALGNNKKFIDFCLDVNCAQLDIPERYKSCVVVWYGKRVRYEASALTFTEDCPTTQWKAQLAANDASNQAADLAKKGMDEASKAASAGFAKIKGFF